MVWNHFTLSTESPIYLVKNNDAVSEKKTFKDNTILYMYIAPKQGKITPVWQKIQPLVFILWKWFFNISPYKSMGMQIWPCRKNSKVILGASFEETW